MSVKPKKLQKPQTSYFRSVTIFVTESLALKKCVMIVVLKWKLQSRDWIHQIYSKSVTSQYNVISEGGARGGSTACI